jgi:hypothetical protein
MSFTTQVSPAYNIQFLHQVSCPNRTRQKEQSVGVTVAICWEALVAWSNPLPPTFILKMETAGSPEIMLPVCYSTWYHSPEGSNLNTHHCRRIYSKACSRICAQCIMNNTFRLFLHGNITAELPTDSCSTANSHSTHIMFHMFEPIRVHTTPGICREHVW